MKYLHTMVRVSDLDASLRFYRDLLGFDPHRCSSLYVPSPFPDENRLVMAIDDVDTDDGHTLEVQGLDHVEGQVAVTKSITLRGFSGDETIRMGVDTGNIGDDAKTVEASWL